MAQPILFVFQITLTAMPAEIIFTQALIRYFGKIPVIRYVCCSCGYAENWVENEEELEEIRKTFR